MCVCDLRTCICILMPTFFFVLWFLFQENKRLADIVARASQSESHEQDFGWDDEDEEEELIGKVN